MLPELQFILVTRLGSEEPERYLRFIHRCAQHGISAVQLREKHLPRPLLLDIAKALHQLLTPLAIPLYINDDVYLAAEVGARGVHLGQSDCPPEEARKILGPDKIIGISIETRTQLEEANRNSAINYISASPVFATKSKPDTKTPWGLAGLTECVSCSTHPIITIGDITPHNIASVMQTGVQGVAVIGALHDTPDPASVAQLLSQHIRRPYE